jgi:integrase
VLILPSQGHRLPWRFFIAYHYRLQIKYFPGKIPLPCSDLKPLYGFRNLRVHDLRHTFGQRLRFAGCSVEDRKDLLGHKNGDITTHYSQVEIERLKQMVKLIEKPYAHKMPTLKVVGV